MSEVSRPETEPRLGRARSETRQRECKAGDRGEVRLAVHQAKQK